MSYDIRLAVKVENLNMFAVIDEPVYSSSTYNLGKMLRACMGWDFEQGNWYQVSVVWPMIEHGIAELHMHPDKYKKYNPSNGWGDISSAMEALESLSECIRKNVNDPDYGWQNIPAEHLWMRW